MRNGFATSASKTRTNPAATAIVRIHSASLRTRARLRAARRARRAPSRGDDPLDRDAERAWDGPVSALEPLERRRRLAPPGAQAGDALEVRCQLHGAPLAGDPEDRVVRDLLGLGRLRAARRVAVVHHDVRDVAGVADLREERDVPFAGAVDDRDRLLVDVEAERAEHERERELLGAALDEQRRAGEEDLRSLRVELGEHAKRL